MWPMPTSIQTIDLMSKGRQENVSTFSQIHSRQASTVQVYSIGKPNLMQLLIGIYTFLFAHNLTATQVGN